MLELFIDKGYTYGAHTGVPLELDLFCDFANKSYFQTVFGGVNQARLKMVPKIGNSYLREIILDPGESDCPL